MENKKSLFEIIKKFFIRLFSSAAPVTPESKKTVAVSQSAKTQPEILDVAPEEVDAPDSSDDMTWSEFENLIIKLFQQRDYSLVEKRAVTDNASDLVLKMNNEMTLVDCKQWKDAEVDVAAVSTLYECMEQEDADHGIVVTSGVFTPAAIDFSLGKAILLIDGSDLYKMVQALSSFASTAPAINHDTEENVSEPPRQQMPELEPLCPICSMKMIKRTAKKGKNKGNHFWGCSQYPRCRGVSAVD